MSASGSARRRNLALQILFGRKPIKEHKGNIYDVPSATVGSKYYTVNLNRDTCECRDFALRSHICKHIYAARMYHEKIVIRPQDERIADTRVRNPKNYDRLRSARRPVARELLRCLGSLANHAA